MIEPAGIVIGASCTLALVGLARRLFFGPAIRVPGEPGRDHGLGAGVHGASPRSRPGSGPAAAPPSESTASPRRVQDDAADPASKTQPRTVQMGVGDQVRSFVAWMLDDGAPVRLTDKRTLLNYKRWAEMWNVVPIPASLLLNQLKEHPQVLHKRDRLLDAHGRALRNANGTPLRATYYTFGATKKKPKAKRPGTVPVVDLVPLDPLLARPRIGQQAQPPPSRQPLPGLPERIAA